MISEKETTRISKFLSLALRHQPETIGISLDENGWTDVAQLLQQLNQHQMKVDMDMLMHVVETNNKKRFAFNNDHTQIRASQGHSVQVDLGYVPAQPPAILYYGTAVQNLPSILNNGLEKRSRQHVHLSADTATAIKVGQRHGKPQVLVIDAQRMQQDGFTFYLSANSVWLTDAVPAKYISVIEREV
ncbi:RNA 2'-phosphotransferase [Mucilaginibacter koreensis]